MQHEFPILINITVALLAAFIGGLLARRLKLPPMVGYMLAGVAIGPFTPGFSGDLFTIQQLAELGVIFLLFDVGLHFSLRDLWAVRDTVISGALIQMVLITGLGLLLAHLWGWSLAAGILLGLALSIASTVVMIRNLMDQGLLNTSHGQVAIGWLVLEDLVAVLILVLLPALSTNTQEPLWQTASLALLKTGAFAALMLVAGKRIIPWFLLRVAHLRSRELFIVAIVVITLGTAIGASSVFGVSLALGAFLAGVVVSESALSHQVGAEIVPFRETFTVLFFVSVGMLVNPLYLLSHVAEVLLLILVIVLGKFVLTIPQGMLFPRPARTALILAAGRSQIGEFSFILGTAGIALGVFKEEQYSLLLAGALLSITLNPFLFRALPWIETHLRKVPVFWSLLDRHGPVQAPIAESLRDHVVVIDCGRVGQHLVNVLGHLGIPRLVVEQDIGRVTELGRQGVPTLYGDAANSDILSRVHLKQARAVVVTLPDEAAASIVVATAHAEASHVPVIVRAATQEGVRRLFALGAQHVIYPELEGGLEIMRETLDRLGYLESDVQEYTDAVRGSHYDLSISSDIEQRALEQMLGEEKQDGLAASH
ncbi:MAG: sodium:proton exchanger [Ktedonobacter sp. 13_1_40CM_4_52_4]|nr:MAG: sodium:proton exchanger [Ktedonobacter sp. 13_1_40CM_4_52_4]